jgi:transposase
MQHIAIDLGGKESQICVRTLEGQIVHEGKAATRDLGRFLKRQPESRVVLETCSEAFSVADAALALGHEVRVVPATLVRSLGVGARSMKTDVRDARVLSEVSCRIDLPSVHVPTELARERRSMCGM